MKSDKNWVILFVRTGDEERIIQTLNEEQFFTERYLPFLPAKETSFRRKGVIYKTRKPLFPGYIFIQTEIAPQLIADDVNTFLKGIKNFYRILYYGNNRKDVAMRESERLYWERLFDSDFCITGSMGFIEGDKVYVISGALLGLEGQIKGINRHKREAIVEMEMMGQVRCVSLMLEVVEKK